MACVDMVKPDSLQLCNNDAFFFSEISRRCHSAILLESLFVRKRIGIIHALLEGASRCEAGCMERTMRAAATVQLDPTIPGNDTRDFHAAMRAKIVGQEEGVQALVDLYQVFCAGLNSPGRPVGNLLFLGPTGSGKTRTVEAAAEILFGDTRAVIKGDCAEFH